MMSNDFWPRTVYTQGRGHRAPSPLSIFAWAFALLFIAVLFVWREPVAGFLWKVLEPIAGVRDTLMSGVRATLGPLASKEELAKENASLKAALIEARNLLVDRGVLLEENLTLKELAGRTDIRTTASVLAGIVARPPLLPYDTLIIDAGSGLGVGVGDYVRAGSAYIGEVSDVYEDSSRVVLFSSAGKSHEGILGMLPVVLVGQGAGVLSTQVPLSAEVAVGDAVVLPGIGGGVSEIVSAIDIEDESSSFKKVYLHLPASIFTLRYVEVEKMK